MRKYTAVGSKIMHNKNLRWLYFHITYFMTRCKMICSNALALQCAGIFFFSRTRRRAVHQYIKKKRGKEPPKQKKEEEKNRNKITGIKGL